MMQLFCSNEDMSSGNLKDSFADCFMASNDSSDASPPYRSRCNTWPKLVRGINSESDISATSDEAWGGGSLLPLVSEEVDELSEATSLSSSNDHTFDLQSKSIFDNASNSNNSCATPPNLENPPIAFPTQQFSPHSNHANSSTSPTSNASTRRNPWGNCSYADLITQAIQSSPDQRLTVSQIYEWLVKNISFFADKGDSNSSAGWKNSIRHNLSLHPKFVRVQNEGTGKSSWWIINPDVKPGVKPSRRRAMSMETSSARQRKNNLGAARSKRRNVSGDHHFHHFHHSNTSSQLERTLSSGSLPPYDYSDHSDHFRPRASSSASSCGQPGSPKHISSSTDFLNSIQKAPMPNSANSWSNNNQSTNGSSLSPTLFNVVERLNLQDSMEEETPQSGDTLDNITLNDLNLDYETTKLLDSFLSPSRNEPRKSEKEFVPIAQQKLKILEQRDSNSRGSSMSTSTPSSPPGLQQGGSYLPCSFVPQPQIAEDLQTHSSYFEGGGNHELMDTNFSSQEDQLLLQPMFSEQFKSFDDVFLGSNSDNASMSSSSAYIHGLSLNNFFNGSPEHRVTDNTNKASNKTAQLSLNSY